MNREQAEQLGYEMIPASPFEAGLVKNGKGIRTWFAEEFDGKMPPLDHKLVMEAILRNENII